MTSTLQNDAKLSLNTSNLWLVKLKFVASTLATISLVSTTGGLSGCSTLQPSSNSVYMVSGAGEGILKSKIQGPKHYRALGSGYEMVDSTYPKSYYISSNHAYSKFKCKVDPSYKSISDVHVVYGKNTPADKFSDIPNNYEPLINVRDKPSSQAMINQLREKCLTASLDEAEAFKFDATVKEELAKKAKEKREADAERIATHNKFKMGGVQFLVYAYYEDQNIDVDEPEYWTMPIDFITAVAAAKLGNLKKGELLKLSPHTKLTPDYVVNQPTSNGYRLTYVEPYDRWKKRESHLPILIKTKETLITGTSVEGKLNLLRFDGFQNYTSVAGSLVQAAVFTDLETKPL